MSVSRKVLEQKLCILTRQERSSWATPHVNHPTSVQNVSNSNVSIHTDMIIFTRGIQCLLLSNFILLEDVVSQAWRLSSHTKSASHGSHCRDAVFPFLPVFRLSACRMLLSVPPMGRVILEQEKLLQCGLPVPSKSAGCKELWTVK